MHLLNRLGQYSRNVSNGTEELKSASSMQKVVSSLQQLKAGSVFEGTVSLVRNGKVTLALSDGQTVTARLSGKVALSEGMSMFFQVKSNEGNTLEIKPYTQAGNSLNPILMNALTQAGIPVTERNLQLVDAMMKEQMPIDRQSVADMVRTANMNQQVAPETMVAMTKLSIPVSNEMAVQFEHYQTEQREILDDIERAAEQLTEEVSGKNQTEKEAVWLNEKILSLFFSDEEEPSFLQPDNRSDSLNPHTTQDFSELEKIPKQMPKTLEQLLPKEQLEQLDGILRKIEGFEQEETLYIEVPEEETFEEETETDLPKPSEENRSFVSSQKETDSVKTEKYVSVEEEKTEVKVQKSDRLDVDAAALTEEEEESGQEGKKVTFHTKLTAREFLQSIALVLSKKEDNKFEGIQNLFGDKTYKTLLKQAILEQWTLNPQELKEKNKGKELYEKLDRQMKQLDHVLEQTGLTKSPLKETVATVRGNIEFMNQLNQVYTYMQIPLKMAGKNVNSELYVYTNKKNLKDKDAEVSAFLHLDLEHLGSTDISVKMLHKKVTTHFYMPNDTSYDLVEKHLPLLEKRLKEKGYECKFSITKEEKKIDFDKDFLRKDMPAQGKLHRYSFDMRA